MEPDSSAPTRRIRSDGPGLVTMHRGKRGKQRRDQLIL